ncbi:TIGR03435 family protein [Granulicella paludicola]|uniref:TIGR03435 family protein n=1 Tax=Granulicella paludicola TaxID=474951 RepID=UPI0021DF7C9E|nr:TIGR03435 family protein [Granulicella paludicola]
MRSWDLNRFAAVTIAFAVVALPIYGQLPTMSDVDRGTDVRAAGPLPEWDVAVVKPHPPDDPTMSWQMSADAVELKNLPLEQMICSAWDLKPYQISGLSGWMKSTGFDLTAKVNSDDMAAYKKLSGAQRREMLQKLLTERFQLKVHTETKTLPIYDLVLDKSGPKFKVTTAIEAPSQEEMKANPDKYKKGFMTMGQGMYEGTGVPVRSLASQLANAVSKPVHDETGLTGLYDIKLHYRPEDTAPDNGENPDTPSVFLALQEQLGLKLVPNKGPVETLVVDAAQKPEAN